MVVFTGSFWALYRGIWATKYFNYVYFLEKKCKKNNCLLGDEFGFYFSGFKQMACQGYVFVFIGGIRLT